MRLARDAADTLALRNGTNAQTFRVYKTYTDASNYQRVALYASAGGNIVLEQQVAGTGVATDFYIGNSSGSSNVIIQTGAGIARWKWDSNGHFLANADNTYDIGASGANRPRSIYAGTGFVGNLSTGSGAYSSVGAFGFYSVNSGSGGSTNGFNFARDGSTNGVCLFRNGPETDSGFLVFGTARNTSFPALKRSSAVLQVRLSDDSSYTAVEASTVRTATAYTVATLPAAGTAGRRAYVTDATAPTFLGTLTGGGAVVCPVFDDGTNWVAA